jgi:acetyl esterase
MQTADAIAEIYKGDLRILQSRRTGNELAAILFFHGGGWWSGAADTFLTYWPYLLEHPVWCFSADYRVASRHQCSVYDAIEDANCAVEHVTDRIGGLPLFLCGASAGGALALLASINVRVAGLICFNPVLDLSADGFVNARTPKDGDTSISPIHLLGGKRFPPILILQGEEDKTTPLRTAEAFAETAASVGQAVELVRFPGLDHGFFNMGPSGRELTAPLVWKFVQSRLSG